MWNSPKNVIILPSRELAHQVTKVAESLLEGCDYPIVVKSVVPCERANLPYKHARRGIVDLFVTTPGKQKPKLFVL